MGEGYINYGPVGVFIFPFLFGLLLRLIYEKSKSQKGYMAVLIYLMANLIGIIRSFGGIIVL
ncbi:O-antigen polysaccharide polymerase Wzy [Hankyongella ginsenosidimutans]|uniref:O-antigen polysaccharide polymerase Wzy n=1 Tax=Hankyongella ginsenosidimutans TaxID=1763828 RepID=A0A4D7C8Z0_9SPHN|nr:O-antigen polysaccharide polymerase Wzy [Hankyongella ginsenosidimutans]